MLDPQMTKKCKIMDALEDAVAITSTDVLVAITTTVDAIFIAITLATKGSLLSVKLDLTFSA
jgi:hypothetical protein